MGASWEPLGPSSGYSGAHRWPFPATVGPIEGLLELLWGPLGLIRAAAYIVHIVYIVYIMYIVYVVHIVDIVYIVYIVHIACIVYIVYIVYIVCIVYIVHIVYIVYIVCGASWGPIGLVCAKSAKTHICCVFFISACAFRPVPEEGGWGCGFCSVRARPETIPLDGSKRYPPRLKKGQWPPNPPIPYYAAGRRGLGCGVENDTPRARVCRNGVKIRP